MGCWGNLMGIVTCCSRPPVRHLFLGGLLGASTGAMGPVCEPLLTQREGVFRAGVSGGVELRRKGSSLARI